MMKFNNLTKFWYALLIVPVIMISSCKEDPAPVPAAPVASFQFEVDANDFLKVTFTNFSTNAVSYGWDFGDNVGTSTDENPVYSYSAAGTYSVTLTATNSANVSKEQTKDVIITDPLAAQRALIGADGKDWYLVADVSMGNYPWEVGPEDRSTIWWAYGRDEQLCVRECLMDDVWTFNTDGTFTYDNHDDFYGGKGSYWNEALIDGCFDATVPEHWIGNADQDLSDWNSGTHPFVFDVQAATIVITGGFLGMQKAGTDQEVSEPQPSVTYIVDRLVESAEVDTLVLETRINDGTGYWKFTLVSYHDIADQVVTEACPAPAMVTFIVNMNKYTGKAITPEVNGTFNGWCGSCWAMTETATAGVWEITKELAVGEHRFKFSADSWGDQEDLTGVTGCTVFNDPNTDRIFTVVSGVDMTIGPVCWGSCDDCL